MPKHVLALSSIMISKITTISLDLCLPMDEYWSIIDLNRDTVMAILALMDPHGTRQRKQCRMERRVYRSMVGNFS